MDLSVGSDLPETDDAEVETERRSIKLLDNGGSSTHLVQIPLQMFAQRQKSTGRDGCLFLTSWQLCN